MKKFPIWKTIETYLHEAPLPDAVFQLTPRYLTGLRVLSKEKKAGAGFIVSLPEGAVRPSFDRSNLTGGTLVEDRIKEGMRKLGLAQGTATVLVPEICARAFILSLEASSLSPKERDKIVRWKIGKLMPSLAEDARFISQTFFSRDSEKIAVAVVRPAVIREYEDLFSRCNLAVGNVSLPLMSLLNLLPAEDEEDFLAVNVEEDALSVAAVINSELSLYRQKPLTFDRTPGLPLSERIGGLLKEIENTINFLEDKEKKKIRSLWLRPGLLEEKENLSAVLGRLLALSIHEAGSRAACEAGDAETNLLSPLFGMLE